MRALAMGKALTRFDRCLDEERHEAETDAVLLFELVLETCPQGGDRRHVRFIESRQCGGGLLRCDQLFRDAQANGAHRLSRLAFTCRQRLCCRDWGWRCARSGCFVEHVFLDDSSIAAGAGNRSGIDAFFGDDALRGGGENAFGDRRSSGFCGLSLRLGRRQPRFDRADDGANSHDLIGLNLDAYDSFAGRRHAIGGFVGFDFEHGLVDLDEVAVFLEPAHDAGFLDRFANIRDFDVHKSH